MRPALIAELELIQNSPAMNYEALGRYVHANEQAEELWKALQRELEEGIKKMQSLKAAQLDWTVPTLDVDELERQVNKIGRLYESVREQCRTANLAASQCGRKEYRLK